MGAGEPAAGAGGGPLDAALARRALRLVAALDGEALQEALLRELAELADAQGAALWVAGDDGRLALRAWRGLVDRAALPARLDPRGPELAARLAAGLPYEPAGAAPGESLHLPLLAEGEPEGLLLLADRARGPFGEEERAAAAALGRFAAVALRNARRHAALERVGLRDRESGAYNLSYFVDYAGKEFYKSRRYGRAFSLAVLAVEGAARLRREAGGEAFRAATRGLVAAVGRAARDADLVAKVSDAEYYVLLPETDHFGARMFGRRAAEEARREPALRALSAEGAPALSLGAATFPRDGEDFDELIHAARVRLEEERRSPARRLPLDALGPSAFWELADLLLGEGGPVPDGAGSARRSADPELFAAAQREAARELARDPRARGLLYVGTREAAAAPLLAALPPPSGTARAGDASARVALLGPRGAAPEPQPHPLLTRVPADGDRRLQAHEFLLFLSEQSAYALLQRPGGPAFHTADPPLVDALVSRLQALHDLEPM